MKSRKPQTYVYSKFTTQSKRNEISDQYIILWPNACTGNKENICRSCGTVWVENSATIKINQRVSRSQLRKYSTLHS